MITFHDLQDELKKIERKDYKPLTDNEIKRIYDVTKKNWKRPNKPIKMSAARK